MKHNCTASRALLCIISPIRIIFRRRRAWWTLALNFIYVIVWTVFAMAAPWYRRPIYEDETVSKII